MKSRFLYSLIVAVALLLTARATISSASNARGDATELRKIRVLAIRSWRGDRTFKTNLQRELRAMGFSFTTEKSRAQAFVKARGGGNEGDFTGELWIYNRAGKLLWHEKAYRPRRSNQMAYQRIAAKLRAALGR